MARFLCGDQPMLRAYPQDHPTSQHICNSRVSRPPYMATRQPGITPKYGIFTYILGLGRIIFDFEALG